MIVRVLGEGQYELDESAEGRVQALDDELGAALGADDEARFAATLDRLLAEVREHGRQLDAHRLVPSDVAVPSEGSSISEVRKLLAEGTWEHA